LLHQLFFFGRKITQDVGNDFILAVLGCFLSIGPPDADTYPDKFLIPDVLHNGIDAFMSGGTPTQADTYSAQRQVEVIVDDNQILNLNLEFSDQSAHTSTAVIHKGLRFGKDNIMPGDSALGDFSPAAAAGKGQVVILRKTVDARKPDIMPVAGVFSARIPQPDN